MNTEDDQTITKKDLQGALEVFGANLAQTIITTIRDEFGSKLDATREAIRDEFGAKLDETREAIRDEFGSKLESTKNELMRHTEEVVANSSLEILDAIAAVVEPLSDRVTALEANARR